METTFKLPSDVAPHEAQRHMKARISDAQRLVDEALARGATPAEALRLAKRQIEGALRAKAIFLVELEHELGEDGHRNGHRCAEK
jgi:hypothetical protein